MFILHKWPVKQIKGRYRSSSKRRSIPLSYCRKVTVLEKLYSDGNLDEREYQAALWYQRTWHLYLSAIEAPRVRTSLALESSGHIWSDELLHCLEERWSAAQEIIKSYGHYTRRLLDSVICLDMPCQNISEFKRILKDFDHRMGKSLHI